MAIGKKTGGKPFPKGTQIWLRAESETHQVLADPPDEVAEATKKAELEVKDKELAIANYVWEKEISSCSQRRTSNMYARGPGYYPTRD